MKPTILKTKEIIDKGIETNTIDNNLSYNIKLDITNGIDAKFQTPLTKELDKQFEILTDDKLADVKAFVKEKLQTLIKKSGFQKELLGEEKAKTHIVTIMKVNKPLVADAGTPFKEEDRGSFRIIIKLKPITEELTFKEELDKLMDRMGVTDADVELILNNRK